MINVSRLASASTETNDPFEENPEASQVLPFQRNLTMPPSEFIQPHILCFKKKKKKKKKKILQGFGKGPFLKPGVGQNTAVPASHAARYSVFYFCLSATSNPISPPTPPHEGRGTGEQEWCVWWAGHQTLLVICQVLLHPTNYHDLCGWSSSSLPSKTHIPICVCFYIMCVYNSSLS